MWGNLLNICINTSNLSDLATKEGGLEPLLVKLIGLEFKSIELDEESAKSREHIHQIFNTVREKGGSIVALTLKLNILGGNVKNDEKYFNEVKNWIRFCGENGCRVLRLKAVPARGKEYTEEDFNLLYRNLLNLLSSTEKNNVKISIDADESAYLKMERLTSMVEDIGSENIGLTLSIKDVKRIDERILEKMLPLVNHVIVSQNNLSNPEKNTLRKILNALYSAFYSGHVSIEFTNVKSVEGLTNCVKTLKEILNQG